MTLSLFVTSETYPKTLEQNPKYCLVM